MPANVVFDTPVTVYWKDKKIVEMPMNELELKDGRASLESQTTVKVLDSAEFGAFNKYL